MLFEKDLSINFDFSHCQQCGICKAICPTQSISLSLRKDGLSDVSIDHEKCIKCKKCVNICPANGDNLFERYFSSLPHYKYYFGYNENNDIRKVSSSGGVCKTLIIEGLKSGYVNGVYSLKKSNEYPYAEGEFYTLENLPTYDEIPNSVYHSVMIGQNISKVAKCNRLMLVGTSCQLRAMEKALKGKYEKLIKICIFCKQQKTLDSTRFLAKAMGTSIGKDMAFTATYRGEGWPGIVRVKTVSYQKGFELPWNRAAQIPFGRRLWSVPGCDICGDPFGKEVNADITLMDPWEIRKTNELGETLTIVHTKSGENLLDNTPNLMLESKNYDEIKPALGLADIRRKQQLTPHFRGESCSFKIRLAGKAEKFQRWYLRTLVERLPQMPFIFYRLVCKIPDWRNLFLK